MAQKKWALIDTVNQKTVDSWQFSEGGVTLAKRRLQGGVSDGVDVLELDNGCLSLTILLTRGMGIWRGKCGDVQLKWDSPVQGPVHPAFVPYAEPSGLGWLYGFDEWLVRCGLENNGSPQFNECGQLVYPLHGRIANIPASFVEVTFDDTTGEITVEGTVNEARLFSKKLELKVRYCTKVGEPGFRCCDTITNLSAVPNEVVLLYHINTGLPFLGAGTPRAVVPFEVMAPRSEAAAEDMPNWELCAETKPGQPEVVFFFEPAANSAGDTETLLINGAENRAISFGFNKKQLPYFALWKSRLSGADGYVVGCEPTTNFPNTTGFERKQGRTVKLAAGESRSFDLKLAVLQNSQEVAEAEKRVQALHASAAQTINPTPKPEWSE